MEVQHNPGPNRLDSSRVHKGVEHFRASSLMSAPAMKGPCSPAAGADHAAGNGRASAFASSNAGPDKSGPKVGVVEGRVEHLGGRIGTSVGRVETLFLVLGRFCKAATPLGLQELGTVCRRKGVNGARLAKHNHISWMGAAGLRAPAAWDVIRGRP